MAWDPLDNSGPKPGDPWPPKKSEMNHWADLFLWLALVGVIFFCIVLYLEGR